MREKETKLSDAVKLLEDGEKLGTTDPAAALPVLREALEACRRTGFLCLEARAVAGIGWVLALLGRLDDSEDAFREAYRSECPSCRPFVDRRYARLLDYQDRMEEALSYATRAAETATGSERGFALDTLGIVRYHAGDISGAAESWTEALAVISPDSALFPRVRANLAYALKDGDLEDAKRAARILRGLPERFKGLKYLTVERGKTAWSLGETLARIVQLSPDLEGWERKSMLLEARANVKTGANVLGRLGLSLDLATARVDLARIEAQLDPLDVLDTLEGIPAKGEQEGKTFDVSTALQAAKDAAAVVFTPERKAKLCEALGALRAATVDAGAAPPVMVYAAP